jgi:macrolide-specific efflux system membrane fusion protein
VRINLKKIAASIFVLCGIGVLLTGCAGRANATAPVQTQMAPVQRGSITILVTGTGNLALGKKQSLSFNQTGLVSNTEAAKISEVNVVEGQVVEQGQVLIKADSKDWENRINILKHQLDSAKANLVQTQAGVVNAQSNLATMQYNLSTAQANLDAAQYNLQAQQDIKAIQDKIDNANIQMQQAKVFLQQALMDPAVKSDVITYWNQTIARYQFDIAGFQKDLQDVKTNLPIVGFSVTDITTKQALVQQAQNGIAQSQAGVELAKKNIESAQANVIVSQNAVDDAQAALIEEQNGAQVITSPIKAIVTKVSVKQGDIVQRNTGIIEIADPEKFEANVMVSERDVASLSTGRESNVSFDALPGLIFPAKITRIAPLGTIQQGVVNYQVTVELTSVKPVTGTGSPAASTPPVNLKDGFSAVVNIPVQQKDNILIVPSSAISHKGQDYVVQLKTSTSTETHIVKIGITDFQNTEIIDGLNQGDQVVIPSIPVAAPTNQNGFFGGGGG